ncbi:hypothetical protein HHI36_007003, partial [Cryptolaemus montrouzieri]
DLFGDEMIGSTRPSLRLGDPSTSSTFAPNMPVCRQSLDDVSSSEEEPDDEGRDPVSHDGWTSTEPSTVFHDFTAVDCGILAEGICDQSTRLEFFELFLSYSILQHIVDESNNYYTYFNNKET